MKAAHSCNSLFLQAVLPSSPQNSLSLHCNPLKPKGIFVAILLQRHLKTHLFGGAFDLTLNPHPSWNEASLSEHVTPFLLFFPLFFFPLSSLGQALPPFHDLQTGVSKVHGWHRTSLQTASIPLSKPECQLDLLASNYMEKKIYIFFLLRKKSTL